jgi:hypothetical protein
MVSRHWRSGLCGSARRIRHRCLVDDFRRKPSLHPQERCRGLASARAASHPRLDRRSAFTVREITGSKQLAVTDIQCSRRRIVCHPQGRQARRQQALISSCSIIGTVRFRMDRFAQIDPLDCTDHLFDAVWNGYARRLHGHS